MTTQEVLNTLATHFSDDAVFVSSLGRTATELFALVPDRTLFLDSMGDVTSIACGIALGSKGRVPVVAVDTDGSHLMGMSILPCIASLVPKLANLTLVVLDNGLYESAGGVPTLHVSINWRALGAAFSLEVAVVKTVPALKQALREKALCDFCYVVAAIRNVKPSNKPCKTIDGIESRYRVIRHLERVLGKSILAPSVKD